MPAKRTTGLLTALALGVALLLPGAAQAGPSGGGGKCTPGAPGVGDEYYPEYGNGGYDARHYGLRVAYTPATDQLEGRAAIRAKATQNLCSFNFDLVGLRVRNVEVNGRKADWERSGAQELVIDPKGSLKKGSKFKTVITYDGLPTEFTIPGTDIRTGFMATPEGATVAGQPEVAAGWFPVNDHPRDKASYAFDVTVPAGYEVAANGFLRGQRSRGGLTTWKWRAPEPMASYLATIDIGDWDVTQGTGGGVPVYDAVDTNITGGLRAEIDDSLSRQGEILDLLSADFGPYPFDTVGAIVPNQEDLRFALETQTRAVYSKRFWRDAQGNPRDADWVVVHELAHQWFGDDVALERWQDIWLNEGFATYAEWMWEEYEGRATPQEIFQATYDAIPGDDAFWTVVIGDPGVELLFHDAVYVRGSMMVQALRNEVGDDAFWAIVKAWTSNQGGGTGNTDQFIALAEQISGQQLDDLFNLWLFTGTKPPPEAVTPEADAAAQARSADAGSDAEARAWLDEARRHLSQGRF